MIQSDLYLKAEHCCVTRMAYGGRRGREEISYDIIAIVARDTEAASRMVV